MIDFQNKLEDFHTFCEQDGLGLKLVAFGTIYLLLTGSKAPLETVFPWSAEPQGHVDKPEPIYFQHKL